ncbi:MAG TPA: hypothetical protein VMO26_16235 [Vicinamibacterales bacterium]|nr:hypothetical protein [Vicinamibacterales bacterium]
MDGLPRKLQCRLYTADFLSATVGFVGGGSAVNMSTTVATFGKTSDGGRTWTMTTIPDTTRQVTSVDFWTETNGIAVLDNGEEVHWTSDGGAT